ncbi:MAG TPA: YkgJ family cysteine cluster protein [Nitrospirota bacterium]|nr:YkgJ family cysteine cluster protein [Nitrospirota bacterium]
MSGNTFKTVCIAGTDARILSGSDFIQLSCGVNGCSSNCCTKSAPIVLNPYEIALICRESNLSYEDLLDIVDTGRARSFPLVMLPRDPHCHFWTGKGCRIYRGRPLACRLYPLGRVFDQGESHLVMPELNICSGLSSSPVKTVADYLRDQDTAVLIQMADRWIEFVSDLEQQPLPDKPVTSVAFHMLVYSPDTPPSVGHSDSTLSLEERFILRLTTARNQIPRYLDGR